MLFLGAAVPAGFAAGCSLLTSAMISSSVN